MNEVMTHQERAENLILKLSNTTGVQFKYFKILWAEYPFAFDKAKQQAVICIDEIIDELEERKQHIDDLNVPVLNTSIEYWNKVKKYCNNL